MTAAPTKTDPIMLELRSVPAIVTFWLLAIWTLTVTAVFGLATFRVPIEGVMLGVLSGVIGTETTLLVSAVSFWLGSTVGAKQQSANAADDNARKTAMLGQLAGAGPPPPEKADPVAP